jgi:hypothetical protein
MPSPYDDAGDPAIQCRVFDAPQIDRDDRPPRVMEDWEPDAQGPAPIALTQVELTRRDATVTAHPDEEPICDLHWLAGNAVEINRERDPSALPGIDDWVGEAQ